MLFKKILALRLPILVGLLTFLSACSGNKLLEGKFAPDSALQPTSPITNASPVDQSNDLPTEIPRYPNATLVETEPGSTSAQGKTRWSSPDPVNLIAGFYQQAFQADNWEILQPFSPDDSNTPLIARRDGLEVTVSLIPSASTTELVIAYQSNSLASQPEPVIPVVTGGAFTDLDSTPEPVRRYIQDLGSLGILTSTQGDRFNANALMSRREYVRWLVAANNKLYADVPGKQIRLGSTTSQPAFKDVPANDPDFAIIQGLAEAGLIPSPLTGDSSASLFRPNAPLTRENLIAWKVPLDLRKGLPTASVDGIKETWGFQDAAKIDPKALRSLYADYQNADQANIRRVFGYTTLFQPQKPVTRAEAATTLWYFGFQGDGISAAEALQLQNQPSPSLSPVSPPASP